jgi:hypothetical protein
LKWQVNSDNSISDVPQVGNSVVSVIPPLSHVDVAKILHFGEVPKHFDNFLKTSGASWSEDMSSSDSLEVSLELENYSCSGL